MYIKTRIEGKVTFLFRRFTSILLLLSAHLSTWSSHYIPIVCFHLDQIQMWARASTVSPILKTMGDFLALDNLSQIHSRMH